MLYRAAHEGLRNAVRHADAAAVAVRLACDDGHAVLEIADDGKGFDPATLGERAIDGPRGPTSPAWPRCRLRRVAGALVRVGDGTSLRIEVPVT